MQNDTASGDRRQLEIVDEDDPALANEAAQVDQIEKDPVEAVIAIDERQIEPPSLRQEARQRDLRCFRMELDQLAEAGLFDELESAVGEPPRLIWIENATWRASVRPLTSNASQMNSAEIPYPSPISIDARRPLPLAPTRAAPRPRRH